MDVVSEVKTHGGIQGVYTHPSSSCHCDMTFSVFVPDKAQAGPLPVLWYLSGLTCTHANVMEKGEYRRLAEELGLTIICPDTSPRGDQIADEADNWQMGSGAGFYVDATQPPWADNYRMYTYITDELPGIIGANFPADMARQAIFGHSMGGHGALTIALKHADRFKSCSAFAPIVNPMAADWSKGALEAYLGPDQAAWRAYDACALIEDGSRFPEFLVDQGDADGFLDSGLRPWLLEEACKGAGIDLTLRMQAGYDHSYYFISSFMEDHLRWHAERLG